jgi:dienelactone hydrolase
MYTQMMPFRKTSPEVILKIYPKAYHGFDAEDMDRYVQGGRGTHRTLYNPEAATDAIDRVREFLERHLK